jgi:phosphoglycolate phosphatase-like HAD superfamily hydrolase
VDACPFDLDGVDRVGQRQALNEHGADLVVSHLSEPLGER